MEPTSRFVTIHLLYSSDLLCCICGGGAVHNCSARETSAVATFVPVAYITWLEIDANDMFVNYLSLRWQGQHEVRGRPANGTARIWDIQGSIRIISRKPFTEAIQTGHRSMHAGERSAGR